MFDFKGLVHALFITQQESIGIYDLKSATRILGDLPKNDTLQAQIEIIKALQQLNRNVRIPLKERLRTIPYIDEKARPLQEYLVKIYQGKISETEIPPAQTLFTITTFWEEMGNAYQLCLKQSSQEHSDPCLALFALRGMRYYLEYAKWGYLRYQEPDSNTWRRINRLYGWADLHGQCDRQIQLYPDCPPSSIQREYLKLLMLALSSPEKMSPNQILLTAQWLEKWTDNLELEQAIRPHRQLFAINYTEAKPPKRLRRDMAGAHWRYWSTDNLVQNITQTLTALQQELPPDAMGLPRDSSHPANQELMQKLCRLWSRTIPLPRRAHERRSSNRAVRVLHGLDNLVETLHGKRPPCAHLQQGIVANESPNGLGIQLQDRRDNHLLPCQVIGIFQENGQRGIALGIVRRLARQADGLLTAGIETLATAPVVVNLSLPEKNRTCRTLFLSNPGTLHPGHYIFVPHEYLAANRECILAAQGKTYRIRLGKTMEYTSDAALTGFSVLEKINHLDTGKTTG